MAGFGPPLSSFFGIRAELLKRRPLFSNTKPISWSSSATLTPTPTLHQISILPRGNAGGLTFFTPEEERLRSGLYTGEYLEQQAHPLRCPLRLAPPPVPAPTSPDRPGLQVLRCER